MTPATTLRELDHRTNDGIDVRLLWDPAADRALVQVTDAKADVEFEVTVRPGERALDVFHHPYAYAAWAGATRRRRQPLRVT